VMTIYDTKREYLVSTGVNGMRVLNTAMYSAYRNVGSTL
jgi:hypothetical protein